MARRTLSVAGSDLHLWRGGGRPARWPSRLPDRSETDRPTVVLCSVTARKTAQELINQFEAKTGIQVEAKFDTEAAKAVGLVQAIRQEKANPRCDVLWGGGAFFHAMLANDG